MYPENLTLESLNFGSGQSPEFWTNTDDVGVDGVDRERVRGQVDMAR